jgi:hypothetical protein
MVDISQNLISKRFSKQEPHINLTPQQREVAKEVQKRSTTEHTVSLKSPAASVLPILLSGYLRLTGTASRRKIVFVPIAG